MEELRVSDGTVELVVLPEVGARIHRLRAFGHDLLRTPDDPAVHARDPFFWGAYVMAPWCNRIEPGPTLVGSRLVDLAPNFPDGTAIHGQVYARPWTQRDHRTLHVAGGGDGWPWRYAVDLRVEVEAATARLALRLVNRSDDPMPAGLGIHPWFRRPVRVAIRAGRVHRSNTASDPGPEPVSGPHDLRTSGEMADDLDATWTDLAEPPVVLDWPAIGVRATMRFSAPTRYVVAASPAGLDAIAVEPETHAPQGLRRLLDGQPGGLTLLARGQALELGVELAFERVGDG